MITNDFNEWVSERKGKALRACNMDYLGVFDAESAKKLLPHFKGLMTAPTETTENGDHIAAKTFVVLTWSDFALLDKKQGDLYLMDLSFFPSIPRHHHVDPETFEVTAIDETPEFTTAHWKIRYAENDRNASV